MLSKKLLGMLLVCISGLEGCCSYYCQLPEVRLGKEQNRDDLMHYRELEDIYSTRYKIDYMEIAPLLVMEF